MTSTLRPATEKRVRAALLKLADLAGSYSATRAAEREPDPRGMLWALEDVFDWLEEYRGVLRRRTGGVR